MAKEIKVGKASDWELMYKEQKSEYEKKICYNKWKIEHGVLYRLRGSLSGMKQSATSKLCVKCCGGQQRLN